MNRFATVTALLLSSCYLVAGAWEAADALRIWFVLPPMHSELDYMLEGARMELMYQASWQSPVRLVVAAGWGAGGLACLGAAAAATRGSRLLTGLALAFALAAHLLGSVARTLLDYLNLAVNGFLAHARLASWGFEVNQDPSLPTFVLAVLARGLLLALVVAIAIAATAGAGRPAPTPEEA